LEKPEKPAPVTNKDYAEIASASLIDAFLADTILPVNNAATLQEWYNLNTIRVQGTQIQGEQAQTIIFSDQGEQAQTIIFSDDNIIRW